MASWSSTGMSFKTKRHGRSRRVESRCSATHFQCTRELRQRRRVGWITPRLPCSLICHMLLTEAEVRSLERDNLLATRACTRGYGRVAKASDELPSDCL